MSTATSDWVPSLFGSVFDFLTAQDLKFTFNENVGASFSLADLTLQNITNNITISAGLMALVYSPNTATITFPGFFNGVLTDGKSIIGIGHHIDVSAFEST